jgi:predicted metal-dependent phosphoesterase TrpH
MNNDFSDTGLIDLHTHSTASDGSLSPRELVALALNSGLKALALTDHDTTAGNREAIAEARKFNLTFVPGVEISCDFGIYSFHILGYWIDPENELLKNTLKILLEYRTQRNLKIISRLRDLGIEISYDEVEEIAGNEVVGRIHFAQILMQKGVVPSIKEAFTRLLNIGRPGYVAKKRLTAAEGINLILQAGGFPVLAHPGLYPFKSQNELNSILKELISVNLQGIEVYYSAHNSNQTESYLALAQKLNLAISGGSDFHGSAKPDILLGTGLKGNLNLRLNLLQELELKYLSFKNGKR